MTEAVKRVGPTEERIAKGDVLSPLVDRETNRPYHHALDEFDRLYKIGSVEWCHKLAADKLKRHYLGSLGVDVRSGDGIPADEACEYPRTYHAQKLDQAMRSVTNRQWHGLLILLTEQGRVEHIGGAICQIKNTPQARAAGTELILGALEVLAMLWGQRARK